MLIAWSIDEHLVKCLMVDSGCETLRDFKLIFTNSNELHEIKFWIFLAFDAPCEYDYASIFGILISFTVQELCSFPHFSPLAVFMCNYFQPNTTETKASESFLSVRI